MWNRVHCVHLFASGYIYILFLLTHSHTHTHVHYYALTATQTQSHARTYISYVWLEILSLRNGDEEFILPQILN
jgi:hypothetical protein